MADPRKKMDRRDRFQYWWPVIARVSGLLIAVEQIGRQAITGHPADAGILTFAGSLILAPFVFESKGGK